jgi:hypothetical protein
MVDITNKVVLSGFVCLKCGQIAADKTLKEGDLLESKNRQENI